MLTNIQSIQLQGRWIWLPNLLRASKADPIGQSTYNTTLLTLDNDNYGLLPAEHFEESELTRLNGTNRF